MGAVAVVRTIRKLSSCAAYVSWPNDVCIEGKKIGGVMCRIKVDKERVLFAILGVGMNLNVERFPTVLKDLATSLLLETHRLMFPFCFLDCFLNSLEELYVLSQVSQSSLIEIVKESFPLTGKRVRLIDMGGDRMVRVRNIDYQGRLIVES